MQTLNIFISGTQIDLQPERDAVERAIKRFPRSEAIRAETRSASDRTPVDGVLWADLPTAHPAETLAAWAREYGGDISRIEDLQARADAVRDILRGKRVLAILDGAVIEQDDEKIAPLRRALSDGAVIVTSRVTQLPSLKDAKPIDLDRMSESEAWELFTRIAGEERLDGKRTFVNQIGQTVDFLPLALDLAASQLREHRAWTLETLLERLSDARERLAQVGQWQREGCAGAVVRRVYLLRSQLHRARLGSAAFLRRARRICGRRF